LTLIKVLLPFFLNFRAIYALLDKCRNGSVDLPVPPAEAKALAPSIERLLLKLLGRFNHFLDFQSNVGKCTSSIFFVLIFLHAFLTHFPFLISILFLCRGARMASSQNSERFEQNSYLCL
jgi:hypothetical protein